MLGQLYDRALGGERCWIRAGGIRARWVRLQSARDVGPWFRWASVGVDSAATLAGQVSLTLTSIRLIGGRAIATLAAS
jgi:hypothetical protein